MRVVFTLAASASLLFLAQARDPGVYVRSDGQPCPPEGSAKELLLKTLNRHKNRFTAPDTADMSAATLAAMLQPLDGDETTDSGRFDPEKGAVLTGFVRDVKRGGCAARPNGRGGESCNCNATTAVDCDTHIEIALSTDAPENQRVIVEVTPRFRKQMSGQGVDWSTEALRSQLVGRTVQFTGWLLFDAEHVGQAENTNPGNPSNFRATCWEVHPVTGFKVLPPAAAPPNLTASATLKSKQAARAQQVSTNAGLRARIDAYNNALGVLYKEDGDGDGKDGKEAKDGKESK